QNDSVIKSSDVIGTYVYRMGIVSANYGVSTSSGLFKSVISVVLITVANKINKKIKGEGILG
ncbi:MAG: sugar ABC transporter permease, partial [Acetatifactor sp.]|nr:sugar ABC transporter permease [Acetatifactor sp.]